jgi:hypothetical protein
MKRLVLIGVVAALSSVAHVAKTQQPGSGDIVLEARHIGPTTPLKIFGVAGSVRLVGWDRDSIVVTSRTRSPKFFFVGDPRGIKTGDAQFSLGDTAHAGADPTPFNFVVYLPKQSRVAVRTTSADIDATDVSGSFSTAAGAVQLRGTSADLDVQSIDGSIDVNASTPWLRATTGRGRLLVRGAVQDVDASTVDGELDVVTSAVMRGRFASVTGDIRYAGTPAVGAIFDFSNHSGAVDLALPSTVSGTFDLSSISGVVENGLAQARPAAGGAHSLRLTFGHGDAQVTVRTFKGTVRLRPSQP